MIIGAVAHLHSIDMIAASIDSNNRHCGDEQCAAPYLLVFGQGFRPNGEDRVWALRDWHRDTLRLRLLLATSITKELGIPKLFWVLM